MFVLNTIQCVFLNGNIPHLYNYILKTPFCSHDKKTSCLPVNGKAANVYMYIVKPPMLACTW